MRAAMCRNDRHDWADKEFYCKCGKLSKDSSKLDYSQFGSWAPPSPPDIPEDEALTVLKEMRELLKRLVDKPWR